MLPSISALFFKLLIFWHTRHYLSKENFWLPIFFSGLLGINLTELASFSYIDNPKDGYIILSAYYFFSVMSIFSLLLLTLDTVKKLSKPLLVSVLLLFGIAILPLFIPGAALAGVASIGYSITRIAGPYYVVVQLGIIIPLLATFCILGYYSYFGVNERQSKARALLFSCSPIFVAIIVIMTLMQLDYKVNASVVLSLMITVTMALLLFHERKGHHFRFIHPSVIYKISTLIPQSSDQRFIKNIIGLITQPSIGLSRGRELIEQEMVREAMLIANGHKEKAAIMLGISRQTLVRRLIKMKYSED